VLYLTFDDGPSPIWSEQILDVLDFYHAGATFYMIGSNAAKHPEIVREIASKGQTVAVHGYNHSDLSGYGFQAFYQEVHNTETVILDALSNGKDLTSQFVRCLRPPYGSNSELLKMNARSMDYEVSMWNIDTNDWSGISPEEILSDFRQKIEPQKVVLMHDGGLDRENTVKALKLILHEMLMQGYQSLPYCAEDGQAIKIP
jgi:peptidoglycan/xylan/chitin deacetylase (PgdA/CDA1 family)